MKRFLIFLFLFPAVATVAFYSVLYVLTGAVADSLSGPAFMYAIAMGPGLAVALVDWLIAKTPVPAVIGTTLVVYGTLVLLPALDGSTRQIFALGIIGAIPAAACSWLSDASRG